MNSIAVYLNQNSGALEINPSAPRDGQPLLTLGGAPAATPVHDIDLQTETSESSCRSLYASNAFHGNVCVRQISPRLIEASCTWICKQLFCPLEIVWEGTAQLAEACVLSNDYRFDSLKDRQFNAALTPVALRATTGTHFISIVGSCSLPAHAWHAAGSQIRMQFWLDHHLAHPRFTFEGTQYRNWNNRYELHPGQQRQFVFYLSASQTPQPIVVPGRYPKQNRAVFSITDHADHDSCERVNAIWYGSSRQNTNGPAGFIGLRLPFTKSVFPATTEADGPGLHNEKFAAVCRAGHEAGIEICPHGVHSSLQPQVDELESLLSRFDEFRPRTWIDHGNRFLSNYGRRGWDPSDEYSLHPWLDRLGIRYVWGRLDFGHALPRGQLDQLQIERFCGSSYIRDLPSNTKRAIAAKRPWAMLHGMSVLAYQLIPEKTMLQFFLAQRRIQRVMNADLRAVPGAAWQSGKMAAALMLPPGLNDLLRHLGGVRQEISMIPLFYPEHHSVSLGQAKRWLFNTLAIHDVEKAYAPQALDRLVESYGIHFSHTYLTSISRAHLSHAITRDSDGHWHLTQGFDHHLRDLARRRDEGQLWIASMGDVGDFWTGLHQVQLSPDGDDGWRFAYANSAASAIDLQIAVLGDARDCLVNQKSINIQPLTGHVGLGHVLIRPGDEVRITCIS